MFAKQHVTFQEDVYPWRERDTWDPEWQDQPTAHEIPEIGPLNRELKELYGVPEHVHFCP